VVLGGNADARALPGADKIVVQTSPNKRTRERDQPPGPLFDNFPLAFAVR
jgi:hypothetical protein